MQFGAYFDETGNILMVIKNFSALIRIKLLFDGIPVLNSFCIAPLQLTVREVFLCN